MIKQEYSQHHIHTVVMHSFYEPFQHIASYDELIIQAQLSVLWIYIYINPHGYSANIIFADFNTKIVLY